jgi:hypothetical protein
MSKGAHNIFVFVINFKDLIKSLNKWLLSYLKQFTNWYGLEKKKLHMWKMKGQI